MMIAVAKVHLKMYNKIRSWWDQSRCWWVKNHFSRRHLLSWLHEVIAYLVRNVLPHHNRRLNARDSSSSCRLIEEFCAFHQHSPRDGGFDFHICFLFAWHNGTTIIGSCRSVFLFLFWLAIVPLRQVRQNIFLLLHSRASNTFETSTRWLSLATWTYLKRI